MRSNYCHCDSTGAGKSIINLLNRFYEINSGSIFIDNQNIENYIKFLTKTNCGCPTRCFPFATPFFNNITLNNDESSREQVLAAAKKNSARFHHELTR
jgi:ABC-type multidrug transport system fused ATPase/permease subunit